MSINYGKNVAILNSSARMPSEPYRRHDEVEEGGGGGGGGEEEEEEWKRQLPTPSFISYRGHKYMEKVS